MSLKRAAADTELAHGFALEGSPIRMLRDGVFAQAGEWDGMPLYRSTAPGSDVTLYCCGAKDGWYFTAGYSELTEAQKKAGGGSVYRASVGGRVPVSPGPQIWSWYIDGKWQERPVTVFALATAGERRAYERQQEARGPEWVRLQASVEERAAVERAHEAVRTAAPAQQVAARKQAAIVLGFVLKGSPVSEIPDGVFEPAGGWAGMPVYRSTTPGGHVRLYWCRAQDRWIFTPGYGVLTEEQKKEGRGHVHHRSDGGKVPVGAGPQTWVCYVDRKWQERPLTVRGLATPAIEVSPGSLEWIAKVGERQSQKLTLRNPSSDRDACYNFKTTCITRYAVNAGQALIPAGTTAEVEIVLIEMDELPVSADLRDRFLIQAAWRDDPSEDVQAIWRRGPTKSQMKFSSKLLLAGACA